MGATLLLLVLVAQSVLLLPLPAAAVVTALVPLVHAGMGWADFARNGLGLLGAASSPRSSPHCCSARAGRGASSPRPTSGCAGTRPRPRSWAGAVSGPFLFTAGHGLILPAMALAMWWRLDEYAHC